MFSQDHVQKLNLNPTLFVSEEISEIRNSNNLPIFDFIDNFDNIHIWSKMERNKGNHYLSRSFRALFLH